jgi:hypothetical protein
MTQGLGFRIARLFALGVLLVTTAQAQPDAVLNGEAQPAPPCLDGNRRPLSLNNAQVVQWRTSTRDQFHERGFVQGVVTDIYPDKTGHEHFALDLDQSGGGDIEIIYNKDFGALPEIRIGTTVVACGDYITAGPRSRLPSPMGAIIHWVHYNPGNRDGGAHPHGFLMVAGQLYGYSQP